MAYTSEVAKHYQDKYRSRMSKEMDARIDRLFAECSNPDMCVEPPVMLDLGCGGGVPFLKEFADAGYKVVGVDNSLAMLEIARRNVPSAKFFEKDMRNMKFGDNTVDVVVANHSILHLPREHHRSMFEKILQWLKGGGIFLFGGPDYDNKGSEEEWLGEKFYESHFNRADTTKLLEEVGFVIMYSERADTKEEKGEYAWIQAKC